ncbi:hypothetical protein AMAG_16362 [Allomyces macrogynus ATCC 38327]|uniref:Uncharacterized protein n=1 Tax=Allomyces macrogynus (strain ATCC 38327) TaxID=578462 RepID=A0A0L0TAV8_ALLM3|nr:hypothetical protein AMAG_16362 [Allomyces macrogynus ATCC 38327]|eukprot:KNE71938.1 hypothetical protein AMAG_16362 [Allomyces macrogynus ATCC 38327]
MFAAAPLFTSSPRTAPVSPATSRASSPARGLVRVARAHHARRGSLPATPTLMRIDTASEVAPSSSSCHASPDEVDDPEEDDDDDDDDVPVLSSAPVPTILIHDDDRDEDGRPPPAYMYEHAMACMTIHRRGYIQLLGLAKHELEELAEALPTSWMVRVQRTLRSRAAQRQPARGGAGPPTAPRSSPSHRSLAAALTGGLFGSSGSVGGGGSASSSTSTSPGEPALMLARAGSVRRGAPAPASASAPAPPPPPSPAAPLIQDLTTPPSDLVRPSTPRGGGAVHHHHRAAHAAAAVGHDDAHYCWELKLGAGHGWAGEPDATRRMLAQVFRHLLAAGWRVVLSTDTSSDRDLATLVLLKSAPAVSDSVFTISFAADAILRLIDAPADVAALIERVLWRRWSHGIAQAGATAAGVYVIRVASNPWAAAMASAEARLLTTCMVAELRQAGYSVYASLDLGAGKRGVDLETWVVVKDLPPF